eukprot:scaffold30372_cov38-Phaeocystis_antarctica.AAC.3
MWNCFEKSPPAVPAMYDAPSSSSPNWPDISSRSLRGTRATTDVMKWLEKRSPAWLSGKAWRTSVVAGSWPIASTSCASPSGSVPRDVSSAVARPSCMRMREISQPTTMSSAPRPDSRCATASSSSAGGDENFLKSVPSMARASDAICAGSCAVDRPLLGDLLKSEWRVNRVHLVRGLHVEQLLCRLQVVAHALDDGLRPAHQLVVLRRGAPRAPHGGAPANERHHAVLPADVTAALSACRRGRERPRKRLRQAAERLLVGRRQVLEVFW